MNEIQRVASMRQITRNKWPDLEILVYMMEKQKEGSVVFDDNPRFMDLLRGSQAPSFVITLNHSYRPAVNEPTRNIFQFCIAQADRENILNLDHPIWLKIYERLFESRSYYLELSPEDVATLMAMRPNPVRAVSIDGIKERISKVWFDHLKSPLGVPKRTLCTIQLDNGFDVTGESIIIDLDSYNVELGKHYAYQNAFKKLLEFLTFAKYEADHQAGRS